MKEIGWTTNKKERVLKCGQMEQNTWVNIYKARNRVRVYLIGPMDLIMKVHLQIIICMNKYFK